MHGNIGHVDLQVMMQLSRFCGICRSWCCSLQSGNMMPWRIFSGTTRNFYHALEPWKMNGIYTLCILGLLTTCVSASSQLVRSPASKDFYACCQEHFSYKEYPLSPKNTGDSKIYIRHWTDHDGSMHHGRLASSKGGVNQPADNTFHPHVSIIPNYKGILKHTRNSRS